MLKTVKINGKIPMLMISWNFPKGNIKKNNSLFLGFCIIVRSNITKDALIHELKHCEQFYRNPLRWISSFWNKTLHYHYELEAYKTQAMCFPREKREIRYRLYATYLINRYPFSKNLTYKQALQDIKNIVDF